MKIAQLVSNMYPVSPTENRAIYSHVGWLCEGLKAAGHEIVLFGAGDSKVSCPVVSVHPDLSADANLTDRQKKHYVNMLISKCYDRADEFDIIHSHFSLLSSFHVRHTKTPTLISVHTPFDEEMMPFLNEYRDLPYMSFTLSQRKLIPDLNWYANIYHGVSANQFTFNEKPDDYFIYLGRVTKDKGVHLAIEASKKAGVKLVIAGRSFQQEGYWHDEIEKHISDSTVRYIGEQSLDDKIKWLQGAKALLFPTQWQEPFGMVMIEALSCGTPVIAWDNGSVPEVIKDGRTGYIVESIDDMVNAIENIDKIDRKKCRARAEDYFSIEKMIFGYMNVYNRLIREKRK